MSRLTLVAAAALALAACGPGQTSGPKKTGPSVATGNGITITADEFKARLDEQSPFIRARYTTIDRKKEFLDNLIRFEVLAREAEKQGLDKDPEVQNTLKKVMVQKLVQKSFQDPNALAAIPDADLQKYYDDHRSDYLRARKVRVSAVVLSAPAGSPQRTKKAADAKKALAKLKAEEKKNTLAFVQIVNEYSDDAASKSLGGDLNFKTKDELAAAYSKEFAEAVFSLKPGETTPVVESAQGFAFAKFTGQQEELNRTFDQVKAQIQAKLSREKKTKEFDEWLKKLREAAQVKVDDKALEAVEVAAAPAGGQPGMPMMPGMPASSAMPPGHPAAPAPAAPVAK